MLCYNCFGKAIHRKIKWLYNPKNKYKKIPYCHKTEYVDFNINLCSYCFARLENIIVFGSNWGEAYNSIRHLLPIVVVL